MSLPDRRNVGEVMVTVLTVRRWEDGSWRVYAHGPDLSLAQATRPVREGQRVLGGSFDQACRDADRVARENGFLFERPLRLP